MDKKLLIVTYYWPPSGGPAVQRWLSLTHELATLGWEIWLLTVDEKYATYQLYDHSLVSTIHPSVHVVKTKTIEPFGFYKLLFGQKSIPAPGFSNEANPSLIKRISRFVRGNFFIPDPRKYWRRFAVSKASDLISQHNIKTIVTAGPPHSTHFIGLDIKKKHSINWVTDFHDLWTDVIYYDLLYHLPWIKKADARLQKLILESADLILTVGDKYKDKLLSKSANIDARKIAITRIGYDEKLFTSPEQTTNNFVISYIGSIAEYYHPQVFFEAVSNLYKQGNINNIKVRFVGITNPLIRSLIDHYALTDIYDEVGYVSHTAAVAYMQSSSVLLLINPVTKDEEMVIPGKIYEYLATQKPIINITKKQSETAALIQQCNAGKTFERNEVMELQTNLLQLYTQWSNKQPLQPMTDINQVKKFSQKEIAIQLQQALNGL
jgi:glycosyltransferase involved in cell wall biosynthesis